MLKIEKISANQFYKEIMEEGDCSFEDAVKAVVELEQEGKIEIIEYDTSGNPIKFQRKRGVEDGRI